METLIRWFQWLNLTSILEVSHIPQTQPKEAISKELIKIQQILLHGTTCTHMVTISIQIEELTTEISMDLNSSSLYKTGRCISLSWYLLIRCGQPKWEIDSYLSMNMSLTMLITVLVPRNLELSQYDDIWLMTIIIKQKSKYDLLRLNQVLSMILWLKE